VRPRSGHSPLRALSALPTTWRGRGGQWRGAGTHARARDGAHGGMPREGRAVGACELCGPSWGVACVCGCPQPPGGTRSGPSDASRLLSTGVAARVPGACGQGACVCVSVGNWRVPVSACAGWRLSSQCRTCVSGVGVASLWRVVRVCRAGRDASAVWQCPPQPPSAPRVPWCHGRPLRINRRGGVRRQLCVPVIIRRRGGVLARLQIFTGSL
jgi:hypothetical protein